MNKRLVSLFLTTAVTAFAFADAVFRSEIVLPRCESAREPVGIARTCPRFTWALKGTDPASPCAGADVRLAQNKDDLLSGRNLVWTKQTAGACFDCAYDGAPLKAGQPYWWQVRLLQADGAAATAWSAPQRFILALRDAAGWEGAKWVGEKPHEVHWRDFDYQVKFRLVNEAFGVIFRAADEQTGYMWQINTVAGNDPLLRPHVFKNGARTLPSVNLSPFFPQGLDWTKEHALKIETRGTRIRTFLDNICVDTRTDDTFADGTIGVRTSTREEARVSEISVKDADGKDLLFDRFRGHIMPAFDRPTVDGNQLVVKSRSWLHPGILPKNAIQLRKSFRVAPKPISSAIASACGYGFYELRLNGASVDPTRVLAPGMTGGDRALFDTYDVTDRLKSGQENEVGFWLGAGYSDDFSRHGWHWLQPKQAILHLAITYADGTRDVVVTDDRWNVAQETEIASASIYNGETIDARRRGVLPVFTPVTVYPDRKLQANDEPPTRKLDPRKPVRIAEPKPGVFVVDFGQNRAGFVEARVKGPKGTSIRLHTSELLGEDGMIDPWSNGIAESTDTFILAGTGETETFCPRFTYHGFQFVEITGWPGRPTVDDLTAWAVHADVEPAGSFVCSDKMLNTYMNAANWSMRSNFMSYPTDCCMRGERTPCQMDSQAYEDAALQFFNMTRYYEKWLDDIKGGRGNPDWTGDSVTLPWRLYQETGDQRILAERYDDMKGQVDADAAKSPDLIWTKGFGDWCSPNKGTWESYFNDVEIVNTSIFCEMCRIVAEAAEVLGKTDDAATYRVLHERAKTAFHAKFFDAGKNVYGDGSQTTAALPLAFGIVPPALRDSVAQRLVRTIRETNGGKVDAGIFGMRYLGDVLCDAGAAEDFIHLMTQPEFPGFGYMFARGATTLWEQWTYKGGMNTHNHAMFSGAASSLMTRLAGIRPAKPGFAEVRIQPVFPKGLDFVSASRETVRGRVAVSWRRKGNSVELTTERPPLTPTSLVLPNGKTPIAIPAGISTRTIQVDVPDPWPPKLERNAPMPTNPPPYLVNRPAVIPVDVGRQLFVDDYLLDETKGLTRVYNHPEKMFDGPVLWPETPVELEEDVVRPHRFAPVCAATSGGLWWDPVKKVFRLWYEAGWMKHLCYAESKDGVAWTRPDCGIVKGTNRVLTDALLDSWNVFPDYASDNPYENWKLLVSVAGGTTDNRLYASTDGMHWNFLGLAGQSGDRTTFFYNPFRGKWVYSLRGGGPVCCGRNRSYWESRDFGGPEARWNFSGKKAPPEYQGLPAPHPWLSTDALDLPDPAVAGRMPQLYNVDAVAYESLMLGLFEILHPGPKDNASSVEAGMPKITDLQFAYSRDGWHFTRPDRTAAIASSRWGSGKWDSGYLSPMGGICVIQDERLWFYYTGMRGDATETTPYQKDPEVGWRRNGMHFNASIGVASMRRDGFVGLVADGRGEAVTHPVRFNGSHLFVNAECRFGSLAVEVLDEAGKVIPGFSAADCVALRRKDSTKVEMTWKNASLETLSGRNVKFRFRLHCGTLYAFWVSPSSRGESRGYLAAGGPAYSGLRDL